MTSSPRFKLVLACALPLVVCAAAADPPVTREAVCRWTAKAPVIDGKLDDAVWEKAAVIENFPSFWDKKDPGKLTVARTLWDKEALDIGVAMKDAEMIAFGDNHNDYLWNGDVFEMFFKPSTDKPAYYELQVNPKSVLLEVPFPGRGVDVGPFSKIKPLGMSAVAKVDGTLDKPGDVDKGWTAEIKIPWSVFKNSGGIPKAGTSWNFAFCRYDYGPKGTQPLLTSSAPLTQPSFHRLEDYGKIRFEAPAK